MGSSQAGEFSSKELDAIVNSPEKQAGRPDSVHRVLDYVEPPGLVAELKGSITGAIFGPSWGRLGPRWFVRGLRQLFPVLSWGREYDLGKFKCDLMAGLTLASLCIPQSIGYANLAGLDPQYGLYTSFVPPLIYAAMGSSREIAIGPVAIVSLLLSAMIRKTIDPLKDPIGYRKMVFTSTFFAGIFQAAFGLFRLGFLIDFLSHAAIVGFMGGAAIVIGLQQLKALLGIAHFTNKTDVISVMKAVWAYVDHAAWHPYNFLIGSFFLILMLAARYIGRKKKKLFWIPAIAPLVSVIISTLVVFLTRADKHGVNTVKHIKGGINPSSAKQLVFTGDHTGEAVKIGLISALVALTEAIAVGRSFASFKGYNLDGNKEMIAMGFMNTIGSFTSCYVATGSFSRTAVNFSAGCQTAVSNVVMSITVLLALQLLTHLLYFTPMAILASIILSSLPGLIDLKEAYSIWEVDKLDFLVCMGTFFGVLFASVEIGLIVAVSISLLKIVLHIGRPSISKLGRVPGTDIYCSIEQYSHVESVPGVLIARVDSALICFFNAGCIRDRILRMIHVEKEKMNDHMFQAVIMDMSKVMNSDTTGIRALEELHDKLNRMDIKLALANPGWQVIHKFKLSKFVDKVGEEWIFFTVGEALLTCSGFKQPIIC
ncbi:low affinity sulfate transporter 3 [Amborella trichopoda]|uniref:low affinity sulfate transporter 3 n=1 Tax=Amborella trichopoda TaxID=13333 RepID=UPI0005D2DB8A|nr:low affinity sulfate transporter 3 [Amborella trichopoda]|eukprot:XP_011621488.1 low affinity sulfate transporter 3 [Amborella trichopoda]